MMRTALVWLAVIVGLGLVFMARGCQLANTPEGRARAAEREAIDRCREAQNDELSDLATRRLVRTACDRMAAEYRHKWDREP